MPESRGSSDEAVVAVTGANGFVGSRYCRIRRKRGLATIACTRTALGSRVAERTQQRLIADIGDVEAWTRAFNGARSVVHLAGMAHQPKVTDDAPYISTNVDGTRAVLDAAVGAGVSRIVFISTVKVNGESTQGRRAFGAEDPPNPFDAYARSKLAAERLVLQACADGRIEACVIRPVLVYGPGVKANFLRLMTALDARRPMPFGAVDNERSMLFVDNLCSLIDACIAATRAPGNVFMAADEHPLSTPMLIAELSRALGVAPRMISVPPRMLQAAGRLIGIGRQMKRLTDSLVVDTSKNRELLGWIPPISTAAGLAQTAAWFRSMRPQA